MVVCRRGSLLMRLARRSTKVLGSSGEDTPGRSAGQVARLAGRVNQSARRSTLRRLEGNDKSRWPGMMVHSGFLRIAGDRQQVGGCNRRRGASPDLQDFEIDLPSWRGREWEGHHRVVRRSRRRRRAALELGGRRLVGTPYSYVPPLAWAVGWVCNVAHT